MPPDAKRIVTTDSSSYRHRLVDLPVGILAHSASFLAAPSKALFAVALALDEDENLVDLPNERSSAIAGNQWDTLDFGQIEEELAKKLSDADIEKVLLCVDAVNNVKRLKLTNCNNITGIGLEPLRGSLIIEQFDLEGTDRGRNPALQRTNVLPILDSIVVEREGCALIYLRVPWKWHDWNDSRAFIGRYNEMRINQGTVQCLECNTILPDENEWLQPNEIHRNTCYGCLKHYCELCHTTNDGEEVYVLRRCESCIRDFCKDCSFIKNCDYCGGDYCNDCCEDCVKCNVQVCWECVEDNEGGYKCDYCGKCYCWKCAESDIYSCIRCRAKCCDDCRFERYRQEQLQCPACIKQSVVMSEISARRQMREENVDLKNEVEHLKRWNKELELEIKELRSRGA